MSSPQGPYGDQPDQPSQQSTPRGDQPTGAPPQWGQPPAAPQPWGQQTGGHPAQQWGQPSQQLSGQQTGSQPTQQWGQQTGSQPTQQWGQPTGGQPTQQWGQPQQPWGQQTGNQPPQQWGQQPAGQPTQQWGQPQQAWGQQTGNQPPPQWGQQPAGPQTQQWGQQPTNVQPAPYLGYQQTGQPGGPGSTGPKSNKGMLITAVAVVVALLAGFGIWWFAIRDTSAQGKETPREAAAQLFADINNGDVVALADSFDPVEAKIVTDLAGDLVNHFKRLGLLTDSATVGNSAGSTITISGITFDDSAAETPLPNLTIVKLTGGTITITPTDSTANETDLFTRLKDAIAKAGSSSGLPGQAATEPTVIDIADLIRNENNGEPLRLSTVERDGSWYPSVFFTIADYWAQQAGLGTVTGDDLIGNASAKSPQEAVEQMIDALSHQDARKVIELLPPDEMAAVHVYGEKIVAEAGPRSEEGAISELSAEWVTTEVTGGTLVSISSIEFTADGDHGRIDIDKDAGVATITAEGETRTVDAGTIADELGTGDLSEIHPNMPDFVGRMLKAAMGLGIVTTNVDGAWFVSIPRTFTGAVNTMLGGMEQRDIEMFIELADK